MRRKWWLVCLALVGCAVLTVSAFALFGPRSQVTEANFHRLQHGMTLGQVEDILGRSEIHVQSTHAWVADIPEGLLVIEINLDDQGRVVQKTIARAPVPVSDRILRWLGFSIL